MESVNVIYIIACALPVLIIYFLYYNLNCKKNQLKEATSDIDVQLKKRHDLIPNILTIAAKYMEHEKNLLQDITKLRSQAISENTDMQQKMQTENLLQQKLGQLVLSVENYPDLKASQSMQQAMSTFAEVEEHICAARRFYNSSLTSLKNTAEIFPNNLIAQICHIRADMPFFETPKEERSSINSGEFFK